MTATDSRAEAARFLRYLDLPDDYEPSPIGAPFAFLQQNLHQLPHHLAVQFSSSVPSHERTKLPLVRNRRLQYIASTPGQKAISFPRARARWPMLWEASGTARDDSSKPGDFYAAEEREWAKADFLGGQATQVGKLGSLLSEYEAERDADRARQLRRDHSIRQAMMPQLGEEEEDTDDDEEQESEAAAAVANATEDAKETVQQHREAFERLVRERLIYGNLEVRRICRRRMSADSQMRLAGV